MFSSQTKAAAAIALLLSALGCAGEPKAPDGSISSEAAQRLILDRDAARDALANRERELQAEIAALKAEIRELRATPAPEEPSPAAIETSERAPVAEQALAVELLNLSSIPIETNSTWTKFSWMGVAHSNLDRPIKVRVIVTLEDAAGFPLESIENQVDLQPGEFRKLSGVELVWAQTASRVAKISGRVER